MQGELENELNFQNGNAYLQLDFWGVVKAGFNIASQSKTVLLAL